MRLRIGILGYNCYQKSIVRTYKVMYRAIQGEEKIRKRLGANPKYGKHAPIPTTWYVASHILVSGLSKVVGGL